MADHLVEVQQWECDHFQKLTGHLQHLELCRFKGHYNAGGEVFTRFWCVSWDADALMPGLVNLRGVLIDTSERVNGITMVKRMTWYTCMTLVNVSLVLMPFNCDDGEKEAKS